MKTSEIKEELYSLKDNAYSNYKAEECPGKKESLSGFFNSSYASLHFIFSEKSRRMRQLKLTPTFASLKYCLTRCGR